jgi:hypothetical protein
MVVGPALAIFSVTLYFFPEPFHPVALADDGAPVIIQVTDEDLEHPMVREWLGTRYFLTGCMIDPIPSCETKGNFDVRHRNDWTSECMQCAGYYDQSDIMACVGRCSVRDLEFIEVIPGGCVCEGGKKFTWDRSQCPSFIECQGIGFVWIADDRSPQDGYWALP